MSLQRRQTPAPQQNIVTLPQQTLLAPFSQEAEEGLLGSILISPKMYALCARVIQADDFYLTRHRTIWETFKRLYEAEELMDLTTIGEDLRQRGVIEEIGGPAYLVQLLGSSLDSYHSEAYARIVKSTSIRRRVLMLRDKMGQWAMDEGVKAEAVIAMVQAELDTLRPQDKSKHLNGADSIQIYGEIIMQRDRDREAGKAMTVTVPESWETFTEKVGDLKWGDIVVAGGATGSGKSAFAECFAEWRAACGDFVSYTHTEMSHTNLMDRRHARHSGLSYQLLLTGDVTDGERADRFLAAEDYISTFASRISYDWQPNVKMEDLASLWRIQYEAGYRVFILDHFQDVTFPPAMMRDIVQAREELAKWIAAFIENRPDAITLILSQLNNEGEIKGGLKIKEKATVALNFTRPVLTEPYSYTYRNDPETLVMPGEEAPMADVVITKHRFGRKGKFKMFYCGPRFKWDDWRAARHVSGAPRTESMPAPKLPKLGGKK